MSVSNEAATSSNTVEDSLKYKEHSVIFYLFNHRNSIADILYNILVELVLFFLHDSMTNRQTYTISFYNSRH